HVFNCIFQAEDGIRYGHVTGVQTCALPIYPRVPTTLVGKGSDNVTDIYGDTRISSNTPIPFASGVEARLIEAEAALQVPDSVGRSEERSVGKECMCR